MKGIESPEFAAGPDPEEEAAARERKPPSGWPFLELFDEGPGPTNNIGGGETYNVMKGPEDLRGGGLRIEKGSADVAADEDLTVLDAEDLFRPVEEDDDEAARFIRAAEEEARRRAEGVSGEREAA